MSTTTRTDHRESIAVKAVALLAALLKIVPDADAVQLVRDVAEGESEHFSIDAVLDAILFRDGSRMLRRFRTPDTPADRMVVSEVARVLGRGHQTHALISAAWQWRDRPAGAHDAAELIAAAILTAAGRGPWAEHTDTERGLRLALLHNTHGFTLDTRACCTRKGA